MVLRLLRKKTSLLNVSFEGESPEKITKILNTHIDIAISTSIQMEQLAAEKAFGWLEKELIAQKAEVESNRHAIHEYKKTYDIISPMLTILDCLV